MEISKGRIEKKDEEAPSPPADLPADSPPPEPEKPKALAPLHFTEQQTAEMELAWDRLRDKPAMEIRDQTFTNKEVFNMGKAALNYVGGMMDFIEAAGRITGMYKPEQVMTRKMKCPQCGSSNPELARFCNSCGAEMILHAEFKIVHADAEVMPRGTAEEPEARDQR